MHNAALLTKMYLKIFDNHCYKNLILRLLLNLVYKNNNIFTALLWCVIDMYKRYPQIKSNYGFVIKYSYTVILSFSHPSTVSLTH